MKNAFIVRCLEWGCLAFAALSIVIVITGGFAFHLGSLTVKAHGVKNPLIITIISLILRRFLVGNFFREFLGTGLVKKTMVCYAEFAGQFAESTQFRRRAGLVLLLLFLATAILAVINPLQRGLIGYYYLNPNFAGLHNMTTREQTIDLQRMRREYPNRPGDYSIQWTGAILIPTANDYQFTLISDDGSEMLIDDQLVVDNGGVHGVEERTGTVNLSAGFHAITIRYFQAGGGAELQVYWMPPGGSREPISAAALFAAVPEHTSSLWIYQVRQIVLPLLLLFWCPFLLLYIAAPLNLANVSNLRKVRNISPLSCKLAAFFLLGIALNIALAFFSERTTFDFTSFFVTSPIHIGEDSWRQMYTALEYLSAPHENSLYEEVFFIQRNKFQYPPTSLLFLEPLMSFSYSTILSAVNLFSWLLILVSTGFLAAIFSKSLQQYAPTTSIGRADKMMQLLLAIGFTVTFYPVVKSFQLGQIQTWLYFFFTLALWLWQSDRKMSAGICIGVICVIKPQIGLLAIWGLLRKQWRFVGGIFAVTTIFGMVSLLLYGWSNHVDYLRVLEYMGQRGESYYPNQSVNGLLNRLLFNGTNLHGNPHAFAPENSWVYWGTLLSSLALIVAALLWKSPFSKRAAEMPETVDFLIAALSFTIASPIAWEHHYSVMLPIFAAALPATLFATRPRFGVLMFAVAFLLSGNLYHITNLAANTHLNFLQSYLFFGALLLLFHLYRIREEQKVNSTSSSDAISA